MIPHIPEPTNQQANAFAHLLAHDGYGPTAVMRMIGAIVNHARAVRLRCEARIVMDREIVFLAGTDPSTRHIVHVLAKHAATMTRRDLPRLAVPHDYAQGVAARPCAHRGEVSERTRDAGHDLLAALICEVP